MFEPVTAKSKGISVSMAREITITKISIGFTLILCGFSVWAFFNLLVTYIQTGAVWQTIAQVVFIAFASYIIYSGLVYQFTRLGHYKRQLMHQAASQTEPDAFTVDRFELPAVFLVPSYKEERRVIRQALISVALQEYSNRRVVLLIDDPYDPVSEADQASLEAARQLTAELQDIFHREAVKYTGALKDFLNRRSNEHTGDPRRDRGRLVQLYRQSAQWFDDAASGETILDHTDRIFTDKILRDRAHTHLETADYIENHHESLGPDQIEREYRRLAGLFDVELTYFERKRYLNLSHESNKAMNLNSYIELMGKTLREDSRQDGLYLEPASPGPGLLHIPDAKYVITLDADSLLLPGYTGRLIQVLEQKGNERIAVIQTPYSAIPNPASVVERIAGATTDIQHVIHQGFTQFEGTYWVGANAVLRKSALEDIRVLDIERNFSIAKYIQDRTVIEDTESSIDLITKGWKLYNFPERLSYSATPPDFGSLLIQRRRWANGGLIILPKLLRYLFSRPFKRTKLAEGLVRFHYLTSICAVNFGLLFLLVIPLQGGLLHFLLPLASVPYFFLYGRDMVIIGYRASDLFRVYALNLMLIPVNIIGVLKSMQQAIFRKKIPFGRTPKIQGRTVVPLLYLVALYGFLLLCLSAFVMDMLNERYAHGSFCIINFILFIYVIFKFIGLGNTIQDVRGAFIHWARK